MAVLTKSYRTELRNIFFFSYHVTNIPLQWDSQSQTLQRKENIRAKTILALNVFTYIAYILYVWVRFTEEVSSEKPNLRSIIYLGYNGIAYILLFVCLFDFALKSERHGALFNHALAYYGRITGNDGTESLSDKKVGVAWILCRVLIVVNCINFIRRPDQPLYLSSLCGSWGRLRYIFLLFHLHIWIVQWSGLLLVLSIYLTLFKAISSAAAKFTYKPSSGELDAIVLRRKIHKRYAQCSVIVMHLNSNYKWLLAVKDTLVTITTVICFGAAAKAEGLLSFRLLAAGLGLACQLLLIMKNMAEVREKFEEMLSSWRRLPDQDAWMRRFLRSTVPRGVAFGDYFTVDKVFILTVAGIIIDNTVTMLMMF